MRFLYSSVIVLCFLILYSIWASYQLAVSSISGEKLILRNAKAWTSSNDLTSLLSAERITEINESNIHFVRDITTQSSVWPSWRNETIQIQPMLDFVNRLLLDKNKTTFTEVREKDRVQLDMFAEMPYVVSRYGVQYSKTLRRRNVGGQQKHRLVPVEGLMNEALQLLVSSQREVRKRKWPRLHDLLIKKKHSFPFLVFFGDHNACDYHNYRDENNMSHSLPLFTFGVKANTMGCWNGFPIASYKMIRDSKRESRDWDMEFRERDLRFPWREKIPKVVWRGSLSDVIAAVDGETPRSKLVTLANYAYNQTSLFDIGFSGTNHFDIFNYSNITHPVKDPIRPFAELQNYVAVIDIDGNAWSSRFPTQLCLNSLTLKVEPRYSDYFIGTQVKPGVHYISIKADLSDLLEKSLWVMLHPKESRKIAMNARKWCREHMVWKSLAHDLLDSWEQYITWLKEHDPRWYETWEKQWKKWEQDSVTFRPANNSQDLSEESLSGDFPSS